MRARLLPFPAEPKEARRIRVVRLDDGALFGEGELQGEIELGRPLRLLAEDGSVREIPAIEMLHQVSPSRLEIATPGTRYRVEFECGPLPR